MNELDKYKLPVDRWGKNTWEILSELMKEQGIDRYAIFGSSAEGEEFPSGLESQSFAVLTPDDKAWDCFLKWDENKIAPDGTKGYYCLKFFSIDMQRSDNPEYLSARKRLNLPLTEEQEKIAEEYIKKYPHIRELFEKGVNI